MANILIIAQDQYLTQQISAWLISFGYSDLVPTGPEQLQATLERERFDLVLLDAQLGLAPLSQIKTHRWHHSTPVIMLFEAVDEPALAACFEYGATDFITKPIQRLALKIRVEAALTIQGYVEELAAQKKTLPQEIAKYQQVEQTLHESLAFKDKIIAESPIGIAIYNDSGQCVAANNSIGPLIGATQEQVLAQNYKQLESWQKSGLLNKATSAIAHNRTERHALQVRSSFGKFVSLDCYLVPFTSGNQAHLLLMINDLSERMQMEERLHQSREQLRAQYKSIPVPTYTYQRRGDDFVLIDYNDAAVAITRGGVVNFVGKTVKEVFTDRPDLIDSIRRCFYEKDTFKQETHYKIQTTGENRYFAANYVFVPPDLVMVHTEDITDRKHGEERLRASEEKFRVLVENSPDMIMTVDRAGVILFINRTAPGLTPESVLGTDSFVYLASEYHGRYRQALERIFQSGEPDYFEHIAGGLWLESRLMPLKDNGTVTAVMVISTDITERKQTEEALRQTQLAVDQARDAIHWLDADGRIFYANDATCKSLGYSREELLSMTIFDIDPLYTKEMLVKEWQWARAVGNYMIETQHKTKDGRIFPVEIMINHICYGDLEYHCAYARDITERKQAEEALRMSEGRLRRAELLAHIGHYVFDADLSNAVYSDGLKEIWGFERDSQPDVPQILARLHPDDQWALAEMAKAAEEMRGFDVEYRIVHPDGSEVIVHSAAEISPNEPGRPPRFFGTMIDITAHKQAEEALREGEERYRQLFELESDTIFLIDNETGRILEANGAASELYGYSREELLTKKNTDLSAEPENTQQVTRTAAPTPDQVVTVPLRLHRKKDGTVFPVEITGRFFIRQGRSVHIAAIRDITERKQAEEQLKASLAEKEVLLKEIHHRVKNNMQVISSLLDLQVSNIKDASVRELFRESQQRIKSMALIHERLYQSQDLAHINFAEYLTNLVTHLRQFYGARAATINVNVKADPILLGVETAIPCGLIINELVSNAFKHAFPDGQAGEVWVEFQTATPAQLHMLVRDNGVGFPAGADFRQTQSLGLTLVSTLVKQIKGTIEFYSEKGTACKIILTNPAISVAKIN